MQKFSSIKIGFPSRFLGVSTSFCTPSYFSSKRLFNLSQIVDGTSSKPSKTTHFPCSIAEDKNPCLKTMSSCPDSLFSEGFWLPIRSVHFVSSVQTQKNSSFPFVDNCLL